MNDYPAHRPALGRIEWITERMYDPFTLAGLFRTLRDRGDPLATSTITAVIRKLRKLGVLMEIEPGLYINVKLRPVVID